MSQETATEQVLKKNEQERDAQMFVHMMEQFLKNWQPEDRYDRCQFAAELHAIARQIYRDAQQPLLDRITKIYMTMPILPDFVVKP